MKTQVRSRPLYFFLSSTRSRFLSKPPLFKSFSISSLLAVYTHTASTTAANTCGHTSYLDKRTNRHTCACVRMPGPISCTNKFKEECGWLAGYFDLLPFCWGIIHYFLHVSATSSQRLQQTHIVSLEGLINFYRCLCLITKKTATNV